MRNLLKNPFVVIGLCVFAAVFILKDLSVFKFSKGLSQTHGQVSQNLQKPVVENRSLAKPEVLSPSILDYPLVLQSKAPQLGAKDLANLKDPFKAYQRVVIDTSKLVLQLIYISPEGSRAVINGVPLHEQDILGDLILEKILANAVQLRNRSGQEVVIKF